MGSPKKLSIVLVLVLGLMLFAAGCGGGEKAPDTKPEPPAASTGPVAEGTVYVAGMGGHLAVADVSIDPSEAEPISVLDLRYLRFGSAADWATHDARVDLERGVVFSSAYVRDPDGKVRVGYADLATEKLVAEKQLDIDARAVNPPMYCGSGQSKDYFLPVMMGYEGWIDVVDKDTLELKHRVFFDDLEIPTDYLWAHGVHSPDMKHFLLSLNGAAEGKPGLFPRESDNPNYYLYVLDMEALLNGKLEVVKWNTLQYGPRWSIAFRQAYTPDGKYILQSNRDRVTVIDADTLTVVAEDMNPEGWETHDFLPVSNTNYGILFQRVPIATAEDGKPIMDGMLQLFDIKAGKILGEPTSVCRSCHEPIGLLKGKSAILCGGDATWK